MRAWLFVLVACGAPVAPPSVTIPTHAAPTSTAAPGEVVVVPNADPRACVRGERGDTLVLVPHGPSDVEVMPGQMTEDAARAKRLFDSEKWAEAADALARVASGDTGDDEGNKQLAQYHLAIARFRIHKYDDALELFTTITKDRLHLKWNESLLWALKLTELDFPGRTRAVDLVAITGAPYCRGEKDTFNNPSQIELRSKVLYYAGRGALRAGDEALARQCFSRLPPTDSFHGLASACLAVR